MESLLFGKRALVTGASSGIGKAAAEAFAREGAIVAVHARSIEKASETTDSIAESGGKAIAVAADLLDPTAIRSMCEEAISRLGGIDIVHNNAGVYDYASVVDMSEEMWDWIIDTDLKAPFLVSKYTLPNMLEQNTGGRMIYTASTNGKTADAFFSAYNAAKHGLIGFVRCLAAEVGQQGITVNAICPGWVDTKMAVDYHTKWSKQEGISFEEYWKEGMADSNMLQTVIPPEDQANFAVYLASEKGRYITGQAINVCAGLCYW